MCRNTINNWSVAVLAAIRPIIDRGILGMEEKQIELLRKYHTMFLTLQSGCPFSFGPNPIGKEDASGSQLWL